MDEARPTPAFLIFALLVLGTLGLVGASIAGTAYTVVVPVGYGTAANPALVLRYDVLTAALAVASAVLFTLATWATLRR